MAGKILTRRNLLLIATIVSLVAVAGGIIMLIEAIYRQVRSEIILKSMLLACWIVFAFSNWIIYKKEKKEKEN